MRSRRCAKRKSREFDAFGSRPVTQTLSHHFSFFKLTRAWCVRFIAFSATIHATRFIFHVCLLKCRFIYFCSEKLLKVALHLFVRKIETKKKWNFRHSAAVLSSQKRIQRPLQCVYAVTTYFITHLPSVTFQVHRFDSILPAVANMPTQTCRMQNTWSKILMGPTYSKAHFSLFSSLKDKEQIDETKIQRIRNGICLFFFSSNDFLYCVKFIRGAIERLEIISIFFYSALLKCQLE